MGSSGSQSCAILSIYHTSYQRIILMEPNGPYPESNDYLISIILLNALWRVNNGSFLSIEEFE